MADRPPAPSGASARNSGAITPPPECVPRADLAVFAHELRGALTVISGYNEMLHRPLPDADRFAALEGIRRAVGRADSLCSDVLSGRPAGTSTEPVHEPVDLWELAERVASEQRAATGRPIFVDATESLSVLGDESALERVVTNLVTNASKYSPAGTAIDICVRRELVQTGNEAVTLEIKDRGPGIPAEARESIFDPFVRLERDDGSPGNGLGLAIVHDVIEAHGGTVEIRDREGGGATIHIEFPTA